jgi:hypothetical protein
MQSKYIIEPELTPDGLDESVSLPYTLSSFACEMRLAIFKFV